MTREQRLWRYVQAGMGTKWCAQRIECNLAPGIPDVAYICDGMFGWLELKAISSWPKRVNTVVKVGHFTSDQRLFLKRWSRRYVQTRLLLAVGPDFLLFSGEVAAIEVGNVTEVRLRAITLGQWKRTIQWLELCNALASSIEPSYSVSTFPLRGY
jgi:hypothetical protein